MVRPRLAVCPKMGSAGVSPTMIERGNLTKLPMVRPRLAVCPMMVSAGVSPTMI